MSTDRSTYRLPTLPTPTPAPADLVDLGDEASVSRMLARALRSGAYKQGKSALRTIDTEGNEKFCCLGVFCDILPEGVGHWGPRRAGGASWFSLESGGESNGDRPPRALFSSYDFDEETLEKLDASFQHLMQLNDHGLDFSTIADLIEEFGIYSIPEWVTKLLLRDLTLGKEAAQREIQKAADLAADPEIVGLTVYPDMPSNPEAY